MMCISRSWTVAAGVVCASSLSVGPVAAQPRPAPAAARAGSYQVPLPPLPADIKAGSINGEDIEYPHPVHYLPFNLYGQDVRMAYMDVAPGPGGNGRTVVLLHGMNFAGFYWADTIDALRKAGFRVVVLDQIGFGRSSKPIIPYNFQDMAFNTRRVLQHLNIARAAIVGHSMGGMLTARFASQFPDMTERAVIYNAIGLDDPRFGDRRWQPAREAFDASLARTPQENWASAFGPIARYFSHSPEAWKDEYVKLVVRNYAVTLSGDYPRYAMVRTLIGQMPFLDPVVYDWPHIKARTAVLGGQEDTASYFERSQYMARTIPRGELIMLPGLGHVPHFESPDVFHAALLKFLTSGEPAPSTANLH